MIAEGEGQRIEFKESFAQENDAIKALCAFAHADGGTVIFGISDDGEVVGCQVGQNTLENFANKIQRNTDPFLTPAIDPFRINGRVIVAAVVEKLRPDQVVFAFRSPYIRVGKTDQVMRPEQIRSRLQSDIHGPAVGAKYASVQRSTAMGFQKQIVIGRLASAQVEMDRGDRGFHNFLRKIDTQHVLCPELMRTDESRLSQLQCEALSRYRSAERELENFVNYIVENKGTFIGKPRNALTGFLHRLNKLANALDHLIDCLEAD